jgi:hypothetical protein
MPAAPEALRRQQLALAHWVRDPASNAPPPGIEPRRLRVYRELVRNTIEGLLASQFPVIRRLRSDVFWSALVDGFIREHRAQTPLFPEVGQEFIAWLSARADRVPGDAEVDSDGSQPGSAPGGHAPVEVVDASVTDHDVHPAFLPELAHYEWAELGIALSDAVEDTATVDPEGDLLQGVPVLSPQAWPLAYVWPVDRIRPDYQPEQPPAEPTLLLLQRAADHAIRFARLDPLGYALLEQVRSAPASGREIVQRLADTWGIPAEPLLAPAQSMLASMRERGVILGTRRGG